MHLRIQQVMQKMKSIFSVNRVRQVLRDDRGATTAEYAVVIMAAVGLAGLLVVILRGDEVKGILLDLVRKSLSIAG